MRGMTATLKKISEYIKSISPSNPQKGIDKVWLENHQTKITTQLISLNESVKIKTSKRKKESPGDKSPGLSRVWKEAATYSPALHCSTIGAGGLNFSVRNGKRWDPAAITTWHDFRTDSSLLPHRAFLMEKDSCQPYEVTYFHKQNIIELIYFYQEDYTAQSLNRRPPHSDCRRRETGRKLRAISSARLWRRRLYTCALSTSSSVTALVRSSHLADGFALRCFQRLSVPDSDTRRCTWRHNRLTGGLSVTVLSY